MKPVTVSFSEIDTFRQCPHKHELGYKQRWRSPRVSPALSRGSLWHLVLEGHYEILQQARKEQWENEQIVSTLIAGANSLLAIGDPGQTEEQDLVAWMYEGYLAQWGLDADWQILAIEHKAEVWLPTDRGTRSPFKLKIRLDLVAKQEGRIWLWDHKSGKDLPKDKQLDIDDQFGLYTWGMRQLGKPVHGSLHSAARTQRNKSKPQPLAERFQRTRLYRTDAELDQIAVEAYKTIWTAYCGPYAKPGAPPRAPDSDRCNWRCDYTEACLAGRKGYNETEFLLDTGCVQDFERH